MFGIGLSEIIIILGLGLIVLGPKKLQSLATTLGSALGQLQQSARGISSAVAGDSTTASEGETAPKGGDNSANKKPEKEKE
ncbi:MAG: twin-arginine translocase TatA/TatE family subunit [Deltaproteobacteria bacterium]|nr:twin-arginine translocase TatA/TatE family subunit [Deltaproteobacteria bacterium]